MGFHLMFKTNDWHDIIYTSLIDDKSVTINNLYIHVPVLIPSFETQVMFNEATQNNYDISYDEWYTERRVISDMITQLDIGSSQKVNSPKSLFGAHQTRHRKDASYQLKMSLYLIISIFGNFMSRWTVSDKRDSSLMNYEQNDYIEQYKDLKLFFKEYFGEELMSPFTSYTDMKTKNPIEIIDLRHQPEHITPKKIQLFLEYGTDPENGSVVWILIRRREREIISEVNNLSAVKVL